MERWLSEGIDVAGATFAQFVEDIYQDNKLYENELYLGGEHVDLANIDMPVLQITGEYDHLIPSATSKPFNDVIASEDTAIIEYPTGHIGLSVSGSSHENVWPQVCEWFEERSRLDADAAEIEIEDASEATDAAVTSQEPTTTEDIDETTDGVAADDDESDAGTEDGESGLETVSGIGDTYADRLREAGIETTADLVAADAATVADAAGVPAGRAAEWIERAS
jgi:polyhydroxyalkanoate synthase